MIRTLTILFLGLFLMPSFAADPAKVFEGRKFQPLAEGPALNYRLMMPIEYDPMKKYPVVLFLHGAGERGDDNGKQLVHGMADFASDENRVKYPAFVIAPQCPPDSWWRPEDLDLLLDHILATYNVDPDRVYLTGLSMGGYGTWEWACRSADRSRAKTAPVRA